MPTPDTPKHRSFAHRGSVIRTVLVCASFGFIARLSPQDAAPALEILTLEQCLQTALSGSDSAAILQKNLKISQDQYKQIVAKNTLTLSGQLGDSATDGFGNTALLDEFESIVPYTPAAVAAGYNSATRLIDIDQQ